MALDDTKPSVVPVREQIYERIKDAILTNNYKPGDVIQIDRLAREFGVSATPIRETLIRLENSGLLTLIPNKGAVVTEFTEQDVRDTWEMRKILEPYAARLTAGMDLASEIEAVVNEVQAIIEGDYDFHSYVHTDDMMHELLYAHIENYLLRETLQRTHHLSTRMRYFAEGISRNHERVIQEVCEEHMKILTALRARDPDAAETTVLRHIENSLQRTLSSAYGSVKSE